MGRSRSAEAEGKAFNVRFNPYNKHSKCRASNNLGIGLATGLDRAHGHDI